MNNTSEVNIRIDMVRRQLGLTQDEFARQLNISQPAVSKYLKERIPPADILLVIARMGNTTIEWLLTGEKSYLYNDSSGQVNENRGRYDADWQLAKKIALLPAKTRQAILTIIDACSD